ncbi:hypothetical protein AAVH_22169 [Aphelenchoides avenae]|nr:hypothetical protein AAVH_22169 [Aphelenchus avenae]
MTHEVTASGDQRRCGFDESFEAVASEGMVDEELAEPVILVESIDEVVVVVQELPELEVVVDEDGAELGAVVGGGSVDTGRAACGETVEVIHWAREHLCVVLTLSRVSSWNLPAPNLEQKG